MRACIDSMAAERVLSPDAACSLADKVRWKGPRRGGTSAPLPVEDWALAIRQRLASPAHICEVNLGSAQVALTLLCRFDRATYDGLDFRNESRLHRLAEQHLSARVRIAPGDEMRSVRVAPDLRQCDVLVLGTDDGAKARKRLAADLPNALRRATPRSVVVMHGRDCKPRRVTQRSGCERPSCAMHGWCQHWQELVEAGIVGESRCQPAGAAKRWCIGTLQPQSICDRPSLLEHGAGAAWSRSVVRIVGPSRGAERGEHLPGPWRYFTVLPCSPREAGAGVCLFFKDGVSESWVGGLSSTDGVRFALPSAGPGLVLPRTWQYASMTHNLALAVDRGEYMAVGGIFNPTSEKGAHANDGAWTARTTEWHFAVDGSPLRAADARRASEHQGRWHDVRRLLTGHHQGCIERRDPAIAPLAYPHVCEFDGRWSLVFFRGRYLLYGRANPGLHGQRFVQMTSSQDMRNWSAFQMIDVRAYHHVQGDMYFFAAQVNPADPESLLALVPVVHRLRGCLGLAVSRDGLRWSEVAPLLRCDVYGERTAHHPAAGLIVRADDVDLYVHENVAGVTADRVTERGLRRFPYLRQPPSRLVRYSIPMAELRSWTRDKVRGMD